ncbi:hypothetical protein MLD38_011990 [Melastoma candidum]|uniref:Uncharacterized protein n=1 Tax=Melastoma candidum TaxID=119954 RepID=A0ACB9R4V9_9MYRT|nr:hypothetical protein MLD38_011990 [Melastoma candidum]
MASKWTCRTLFVICLVVVVATTLETATANSLMDSYRNCFHQCHDACKNDGNGNTFCEMKCDTDCMAKETAEKLKMHP